MFAAYLSRQFYLCERNCKTNAELGLITNGGWTNKIINNSPVPNKDCFTESLAAK